MADRLKKVRQAFARIMYHLYADFFITKRTKDTQGSED